MKNIVENNKLIAEFLGYSQPHPDYPNTTYWYKKDCQPLTILLFHSDWSWLMRVVEKIENFTDVECFNIEIYRILIKTYDDFRLEFWTNGFTKIEAIYNACVEFIKWYNELNKSYEKNKRT